jgi:hypothetical protein
MTPTSRQIYDALWPAITWSGESLVYALNEHMAGNERIGDAQADAIQSLVEAIEGIIDHLRGTLPMARQIMRDAEEAGRDDFDA